MTDVNYNEFTNSLSYSADIMDPMFRCCEHFPERLSRLHLSSELFSPLVRRQNRRSRDRYKTQPITFDEITEVDEENTATAAKGAAERNKRLSTGCTKFDEDALLEKFRLGNQTGTNLDKGGLVGVTSASSQTAGETPSTLADDSAFADCGETAETFPRTAGFAAAFEHARRRRKYSKRCRRRNSDMQEESTTSTMWDEDRHEEVCSGGI